MVPARRCVWYDPRTVKRMVILADSRRTSLQALRKRITSAIKLEMKLATSRLLPEPVLCNFCKVEEVYHAVVVHVASEYGLVFGQDHQILRVYDIFLLLQPLR